MSIRATPEKRRRLRPQRTVFNRRTRAKRGFVLLPRRSVVERNLVWAAPWTPVIVSSLLNVLSDAFQFQVDIRSNLAATLSPSSAEVCESDKPLMEVISMKTAALLALGIFRGGCLFMGLVLAAGLGTDAWAQFTTGPVRWHGRRSFWPGAGGRHGNCTE